MPGHSIPDSRARLIAAGRTVFAEHGFAGARVDRIAAFARVNKAMIYYHFGSKIALYRETLREAYRALRDRTHAAAAGPGSPDEKLGAYVDALLAEAARRPEFLRIGLREIAEKGRHLDATTLGLVAGIPQALARILREGAAAGRFRPVDPLLAYFTILGSILLGLVTAPVRDRLPRRSGLTPRTVTPEALASHVRRVALAMLEPGDRTPALRSRP